MKCYNYIVGKIINNNIIIGVNNMSAPVPINHLNLSGIDGIDFKKLQDVNPDEIVHTVGNVEDVEQYIQTNYQYFETNPIFGYQRKTLLDASEVYGKTLHRIRGDGNCGTTSFAVGLLYHIQKLPQDQAKALIEKTVNLIVNLQERCAQLDEDIRFTLELLEGLKNNLGNNNYLQEALLQNAKIMLSFSRVVRAIGHENAKEFLKKEIKDVDEKDLDLTLANEIANEIIPKTPKAEMSIDGYKYLSLTFDVTIHVIDLTGQSGNESILQYPKRDNTVADIVIFRSGSNPVFHFTTIIPDEARQTAYGLTLHEPPLPRTPPTDISTIASEKIDRSNSPSIEPPKPLQNRDVKPVKSCSMIPLVSIPIMIVLVSWLILSNLVNK